jgi:hypothetical protein
VQHALEATGDRRENISDSDILSRVHAAVMTAAGVTSGEEAFYFLIDRLCESDTGKPDASLQGFRYLESVAQAPHQKIAAIHAAATLLEYCGNRAQAQAECSRAAALYAAEFFAIPFAFRSRAGASVGTMNWLIAHGRGLVGRLLSASSLSALEETIRRSAGQRKPK